MFKMLPIGVVSLALLAVGCKSANHDSGMSSGTSMRSPSAAVMCDQCKTVWVREKNDKGVDVPFRYTAKNTTVCPDCEKAAKGYFSNGTLDKCDMCGGKLQVVEPKG